MLGKRALSRAETKSFTKKSKKVSSRKGTRSLIKYNVHNYRRWGTASTITLTQNTTSAITSYVFTLGSVSGNSELTVLYDQYQIVGVKLVFQLINNPDGSRQLASDAANNLANSYPKLWLCRDYDDSGTESISALQQRNGTKCFILRPNEQISYFVRPAVRAQLYLDGVTPASSPQWDTWLDCSSSAVPHYGVKVAVDSNNVLYPQPFFVNVEFVYYLKFKNTR